MNINNAYPSKWLKSGDIPDGSDLNLTISHIEMEMVGQGEEQETKPVVYFKEIEKGVILNKVNAATISKLHGPETDGWAGKRIALYATEVQFGNQTTLGLRVRLRAPGSASTGIAKKAPAAMAPEVDDLDAGEEAIEEPGATDGLDEPEAVDMTPKAVKATTLEKKKAWAVILPDKRWCITDNAGHSGLLTLAAKENKAVRLSLVPLENTNYMRIVNVTEAA